MIPTDYVFITDSNCDLPEEWMKERQIECIRMLFSMDGKEYRGNDIPPKEFYAMVREGKLPITAQTNQEEFKEIFIPFLEQGKDIIYLCFSSGLSGTYANSELAARDLRDAYPKRKIIMVDSLCASMGEGLLVYKSQLLREQGATIEELANYMINNRLKVGLSFTVDDLMHLHRGGRVSKASAIAGSLLGIKPVLHVDNEGKLVPTGKVRGRKQALTRVVDQLLEWAGDTKDDYFMIGHGDCIEDAEFVIELMKERTGIQNYMLNYIGPVIGTHSGPGTIALFMMVDHR